MSELQLVNDRLEALISSLSAPARKEMARSIAKKLRASQQQNIKRQQAPDGTPFKPRKAQPVRSKKGRIKREMFAKLRTAKYMKTYNTSDEAIVQFNDRVQRIACVHHYGLRDRTTPQGKSIIFASRALLGINEEDKATIEKIIIHSISEG